MGGRLGSECRADWYAGRIRYVHRSKQRKDIEVMASDARAERNARPKVTIVGVGMVGGTVAQLLAQRDYADIVMIDIVEGLPQGKALDLLQTGPVLGYDSILIGSNSYEDAAGSDLVVITSGIPRKPGMSRDDLLRTNQGIIRSVTEQIAAVAPEAVLIVVSNPLDAMCHVALETTGFPRERVIGQAGVLDSARFRTFIAAELNVSVEDVTAFVLGGHGDTMVPLSRYSTVAGIPITELMTPEKVKELETRTANGGAEVVSLLKSGSAFYAPAASTMAMVDSILLDKKRILPCSVLLTGEYGIDGLYVGVPVKLGRSGVEAIMQISLAEDEQAALRSSADAVQALVDTMKSFDTNS
jgi:malate dehydrogenase